MGSEGSNGFDTLMKIDDQIIGVYNFAQRLKFFLSGSQKKYNLARNKELKNKHLGQRCFIVGNGPSIQQQNLSLLKNEHTFFVNHFYRHPQVEEICPKYYTIIDPKLTTGEWPVSMLDEIIEKCPQVKLFLHAQYQEIPQIAAYSKKAEIYWVYTNQFLHQGFSCSTDLTNCLGGVTVVTICLFAAIYMGFKEIYLLGIDCDGIFRDLVDQSSHFYDAKKENIGDNDPLLVVRHLRATIQGLRGWGVIADKFQDSPHKIVNLTKGGLLNVFPRDDFEKVVLNKPFLPTATVNH
jgi:uncharacterized Rossmann fold enzyme